MFIHYDLSAYVEVELPEGKTPEDIKHIWFKWCEGEIEFEDGTSIDGIEHGEDFEDDFKRPKGITLINEEDEVIGEF